MNSKTIISTLFFVSIALFGFSQSGQFNGLGASQIGEKGEAPAPHAFGMLARAVAFQQHHPHRRRAFRRGGR